ANVVLPAPRPPERATRSPGARQAARSAASAAVAASSGRSTVAIRDSSGAGTRRERSFGGSGVKGRPHRQPDGDGGPPPLFRRQRHRAAVEIDEAPDDRKTKPCTAPRGA